MQETGVAGAIVDAHWDKEGLLLVFADGSAVVLDPQSGQRRQAPDGIDVAASVLLAGGHLVAERGAEVELWRLGDEGPLAAWRSPTGQGLHLDDVSADGQLFVYRDLFSGHLFVLRANVSAGALAEVWRSEQTAIDSGEAHLHPTLPLLALRNNSTIAVVDLDAQSVLWQSSSVAVAAQTFRAVQWSTDGQYLITQAQPARARSLLISVGVWRWDGVRRQPVLLQEVAASRLLGVSPDLQWMLAAEPESGSPLSTPRPLLVPILTDTVQLQADVEASCLLTRPLSEQQRQAFLIGER